MNEKKDSRNQARAAIGAFLLIALAAAVFFYIQSKTSPGQPIPSKVTPQSGEATPTSEATPGAPTIRLSDGNAQPQAVEPLPLAVGEPLSDEETAAILARLPALAPLPGEQVDFKLPDEVLPPPRPGATIEESFPAPAGEAAPEVYSGPLEVLRYSPEGEIPIAPFVNVTFSQPMAPLGTLGDLAMEDVPVVVEPALPGTWRWLGTKTLNFQYDSDLIDRMPMATEYTVTIPAGTKSAVGGVLAEQVQFRFSTPPVTVVSTYPYSPEPQPLEPLFFVSFNQRIEPAAVLKTVEVEAGGSAVPIRLANEAEIAADETVQDLVEFTPEGRWLAFKTVAPLPKDSTVTVVIGPGTPSAEGPLLTTEAQSYSFQTYSSLTIEEHGCSWWDDDCPPLSPFYIRFNNPLDAAAYAETMLRVEPEIPGVSVNILGNTISISGATVGRTTYKVTVSGDVKDIFGQVLGREQTLTFKVGPAEPFLRGPESNFVTLDPASSKPALSLYVMNYDRLDVQIYAVQPSDWPAFKYYIQEYQRTDQPPTPPGRLLRNETLRLDVPNDTLSEVNLDLSRDLQGGFGQFFVIVKPPKGLFENERYWEHVLAWVQVTHIGLDAFVDHSDMVVWATDLRDGTPLQGLDIQPASGIGGVTGADGAARFPIPAGGAAWLTAERGSDRAILPASTSIWEEGSWSQRDPVDILRWYVFDDRAMYRPGEEVHAKGWIRLVGGAQDGGVGLVGPSLTAVDYNVYDPQGNDIGSGQAVVNALGGFDFNFTIPENANLGYAAVELSANVGFEGRNYSHSFQIQEFRRPEFEVKARNETSGPYFADGSATVAVEAKYYAGGPLPNADVNWLVTSTPTNYNPPNWPDFTFGVWQPWWWFYDSGNQAGSGAQTFAGKTDASGTHYLDMEFTPDGSMRPFSVQAEATVMDVNRQAWASRANLLVHPADLYVGLRSERYFVQRGEPLDISLIVTDLDGNAVPGREVKVTAARLDWKFQDGEWREIEADPQDCTVTSEQEPVQCKFETPVGGRYRITAIVVDDKGRGNKSIITRWVSGGGLPPSREVEQEEATLIPDKETWQPGDTAEILVQSPFSPAEGLLTVSRSGFLYTERFTLEGGSATLRIPIKEAYIPNLNVQVDLVGSAPRTDDFGEPLPGAPTRPAYASSSLVLSIPPLQRTLLLDLSPRETALEPGGRTTLDVTLKDADGNPVQDAELAVVVVDESILALTNYQLSDPIAVFYGNRPSDVWSTYSRASILLANPLVFDDEMRVMATQTAMDMAKNEALTFGLAPMAAAPAATEMPAMMEEAGAAPGAPAPQPAITVRSDFNPLATFAPDVRTDFGGHASVDIRLPDNLTRYRIMVVAVDSAGNRFGSAESNLTARLPLMVRPSAPRFLNFGDTFELPVVLQNQTDYPMSVDVAVQAANANLTGARGLRVDVPANDRIEVRFPVGTDAAGTARFQMAAVSGAYADAAAIDLPVYTPATSEAFATYGVIDEGVIAQPVLRPSDVFPQFGGLEVQTSSTALQALTDAVLYLVQYPYECSEQMASRVLGIAALRDVLTAFEAEGLPSAEEMEATVGSDLTRLAALQNYDGGFPVWRHGQESIPFYTIHVTHAMARAELKGYAVPQYTKEQALYYLQDIESHYPVWYSQRTRWTLSAYALYVRDLAGDHDPAKARQLLDEATLENLPLEAVGWIWQVLARDPNSGPELEAIRRYVGNRAVETAGAANFTTDYDDQAYLILGSSRRADAILLEALMADNPDGDLIPKVVAGLLAHRKQGRWYNTQENVFVLIALDRYFNTYEAQTPDFVARIWLGDTYAGSHAYQGYSAERHETFVPMSYLVDPARPDEQDLVIQKDGTGRLYYRLGLKYAPTDLWLDPLDMGFVVQRAYEGVDDPEDVYRDADGVWHIQAGARVRVRINMVADNRRYHVALVDPLPAGLEIVNPALAVSQSIPQDPNSPDYRYGWWWWGTWYEHQNMRDERAEAFTTLLWDGVYEYTYIARATTPGRFVVPPAKAEEMYSPEVFGRSGSDWVVVE
ncbi:MAG: alpha-2-macroglobulin family protein [Chloroflexota bacterium]